MFLCGSRYAPVRFFRLASHTPYDVIVFSELSNLYSEKHHPRRFCGMYCYVLFCYWPVSVEDDFVYDATDAIRNPQLDARHSEHFLVAPPPMVEV